MLFKKSNLFISLALLFLFGSVKPTLASVCGDTYADKYQVGCFNKALCNPNSGAYLQSVWQKEKIGQDPNGAISIDGLCSIPGKPDSVCCFSGNSVPDVATSGTKQVLCPLVKNNGFEVACLDFPGQVSDTDFKAGLPSEVEKKCSTLNAIPGKCGQTDCWKVTASYSCDFVDGALKCGVINKCADFCVSAPVLPDPMFKCQEKSVCVYKENRCQIRPENEPPLEVKVDKNNAAEAAAISSQKAGLEAETGTIFNKLGTTDVKVYLARFISGAMGVIGSITLVMFIYGGFLWMTSAGDSGKNETARDIVVWSSLGIAVIFASYAILDFVFGAFK